MVINPVLVETTRGGRAESFHRGAVAVVEAQGRVVLACGDVQRPVFARSAAKPIQALPLIVSGAADRYGLSDAEIALACGSHAGEPAHVATAAAMLRKAGQSEDRLECGIHWPLGEKAARAVAGRGELPTSLHNNCSGKHAGFICVACCRGHEPRGYTNPEHPVMREVTEALAIVTGASLDDSVRGIDGCSIPAYALSLAALATGFARLGSGGGLTSQWSLAAARIRTAISAAPPMLAGEGCFDTLVAQAAAGTAFSKCGAEGMAAAALPGLGLGIAIKIDDGAGRAAEAALAKTLARLLPADAPYQLAALAAERSTRPLVNWQGTIVGEIRALADPDQSTRPS